MPPIDPVYLQVPGYVVRFSRCSYGPRLFESWRAHRDNKCYEIQTENVSETCTTAAREHTPEPVLGSCVGCIQRRDNARCAVAEFVAEDGDNGYLLVYALSDEVQLDPASQDGQFAEYTRNGGYLRFVDDETAEASSPKPNPHADVTALAQALGETAGHGSALLDHPTRVCTHTASTN